jgi:rod shape-determining protein MreB
MNSNIYGIDLGTCNLKIFCKSTGKILKEKNTIAVIGKDQIYAYGDRAYAMYEKAPESIQVGFPVVSGVIADFNFLQEFIYQLLDEKMKGKTKGAEFIVAVPTDITDVEKKSLLRGFLQE